MTRTTPISGLPWRAADVPVHEAKRDVVASDSVLFHRLVSSSFLEITASAYTRNLVAYYADDAEIHDWLVRIWEPEEVNHGEAMRRYVEAIWPDYDWSLAYTAFHDEYTRMCRVEDLHGSLALEMVARCVTETETAATYKMLARYTEEPVLCDLLQRMYRDEVRHYGYFLGYFRRYAEIERPSQVRIIHTMLERTSEVGDTDLGTTLEHVQRGWTGRPEVAPCTAADLATACKRIARDHCDYGLARRMLVQPLDWGNDSWRGRAVEQRVRHRIEAMA